jgi:predicted RNA polymerase sigma factor
LIAGLARIVRDVAVAQDLAQDAFVSGSLINICAMPP